MWTSLSMTHLERSTFVLCIWRSNSYQLGENGSKKIRVESRDGHVYMVDSWVRHLLPNTTKISKCHGFEPHTRLPFLNSGCRVPVFLHIWLFEVCLLYLCSSGIWELGATISRHLETYGSINTSER
jgi:hypothetical protein